MDGKFGLLKPWVRQYTHIKPCTCPKCQNSVHAYWMDASCVNLPGDAMHEIEDGDLEPWCLDVQLEIYKVTVQRDVPESPALAGMTNLPHLLQRLER